MDAQLVAASNFWNAYVNATIAELNATDASSKKTLNSTAELSMQQYNLLISETVLDTKRV
ncbi:MAG: hypothetical protein ACTSUE_15200 [Promethearchaeota archaeon]